MIIDNEFLVIMAVASPVIAAALVWAVIDSVMKPITLQRRREVHCQHAFERHTHELKPGIAFETRFCPKCACTRIISSGHDFVLLSKPVKPAARQRGKSSTRARATVGAKK